METATRGLAQTGLWLGVMALLLFGVAGTLHWTQAWIFLVESGVSATLIGVWLGRHDPALLAARLSRFHPNQKSWDRVFLISALTGFVLWLVLIALDARRFRWSAAGIPVQLLGFVLIATCMVLVWLVFRNNSFAAPQVRLQLERGQTVITKGPYRIVRHPMYGGMLLYFLGVPLLLGGWWGWRRCPCSSPRSARGRWLRSACSGGRFQVTTTTCGACVSRWCLACGRLLTLWPAAYFSSGIEIS